MKAVRNKIIILIIAAIILLLISPSLFAAVVPQGYIVGWGCNSAGEATGKPPFGNYSTGVVTIADQILTNVVAISAAHNHSLALKNDGTVVSWGSDGGSGMTLVPDGLSNVIAISADSSRSVALKKNGRSVYWGYLDEDTNIISGLSNVVAINHEMALKGDRTVTVWGSRARNSQRAIAPAGLSNVVAIAKGRFFLGLKHDGIVVEWDADGQKVPVPMGLSNVVAIAAPNEGANHRLALRSDGTVFGWGVNDWGEATGVPSRESPGETVTIGGNVLSNVVAIATGAFFSMALKKDSTVVVWGANHSHQTEVPAGLSNVVAIAAGYNFCLAITTNSAVADKFRH
jgi:alpha-tubulin suppressor-like RCC1 family protein